MVDGDEEIRRNMNTYNIPKAENKQNRQFDSQNKNKENYFRMK